MTDWKAAASAAAEHERVETERYVHLAKCQLRNDRISFFTKALTGLLGDVEIQYTDFAEQAIVDGVAFVGGPSTYDPHDRTVFMTWQCPICNRVIFTSFALHSLADVGRAFHDRAKEIERHTDPSDDPCSPNIDRQAWATRPPTQTADSRLLATLRDWVQNELDECLERGS